MGTGPSQCSEFSGAMLVPGGYPCQLCSLLRQNPPLAPPDVYKVLSLSLLPAPHQSLLLSS